MVSKKNKNFYPTLSEASFAVQVLRIKSRAAYSANYRRDPRLPSNPFQYYSKEWTSWLDFFGRECKKIYLTLSEASLATINLKITSQKEYYLRYREDPKLPAHPSISYSEEWKNWSDFFGKKTKNFYPNLAEASMAAQRLKIVSELKYHYAYRNDPRLPSCPNKFYKNEWTNWLDFLNQTPKNFYPTLIEASIAAQNIGITSSKMYSKYYSKDVRLPSNPQKKYSSQWQGWSDFFKPKRKDYYPTIEEASYAAQKLSITSRNEYPLRYKEDPRLPSTPHQFYANEWKNWSDFLNIKEMLLYIKETKYYPTLIEAANAAQELGIMSSRDYRVHYKLDSRLPSCPYLFYNNEWKGWPDFLNKNKTNFYLTFEKASLAAQNLKIKSQREYISRYAEDSLLPSNPSEYYSIEWISWPHFLNYKKYKFYNSLSEASNAAKNLNISSQTEYHVRYQEDHLLPSNPQQVYVNDWQGWIDFLGKHKKIFYKTLNEAKKATKKLGIKGRVEYYARYKEDPKLTSCPHILYSDEWEDWWSFFEQKKKEFYPTLSEASLAVQKLGITSSTQYDNRYNEDPRLPSSPSITYAKEWINWARFTQGKNFYSTLEEASSAAQSLKITSSLEYGYIYKKDPLLPSYPPRFYSDEWKSWSLFLMPKKIHNLKEFKHCCKVLGIKNSSDYRKIRKDFIQLPSKPENLPGWENWFDALDIPTPYPYEKLREIVIKNQCKTMSEYKKMRIRLNDSHIPSSPEELYFKKGWTNTFDFFGKPRPYQVKYFTDEWKLWADKIEDFLKSARGGDTKAKDLCEFVREYIERNDFEKCPLEYLTRGSTNIQPMLELFEKVPVTRKKKWLYSINEFLDWIISTYLLLEDMDTGEITPIKGAKNPFSHINFNGETVTRVVNETNKLALPYQFVKSGREWIFPSNAIERNLNYRDLVHLHCFPADWIQIDDISLLDKNDLDCVYKTIGDKTFIWLPMYWTFTYALMQLPARGMQIVYCDSGEADLELADFKNHKVIWKKNKSKLAGLTSQQSMVSKAGKDDFGVHYTSNKTKFDGTGYTIPFMPIDLSYWLIKLRKWQQKYNPINEPTKWLDCERTNLNELQRKQKGINCFLFRDFHEREPGYFTGRLTSRLASALFFSAKDEITTATYKDLNYSEAQKELHNNDAISISHFKSQYTPHSMRVSLINAYAYEFGIPLEVIMKLVGHSSIIMSIYYIKSDKTGANIRERIELGEKEALSNATKTLRSFVEQQRIEECKSQLVFSSSELLNSLDNSRPASSYLFKDFGICPVGGAFCNEGGCPVATKANLFHPVSAGYLGEQNCIQCRFFITGPAFMMGLAAIFNEVSLAVNTQSYRYSQLEQKLELVAEKIDVINHQIYRLKVGDAMVASLETERKSLVDERLHINSEIETRAKKMDLYMSDMNAIHRHIHNCQQILHLPENNSEDKLQLIVPQKLQIGFELDEVSQFHQLSEVCENAELYHSCTDELAVTRRSQAMDKMMQTNGMQPQFFLLNEEEQLAVGNQLTQLMLTRLKGWENVDRLMDGRLTFKDLSIDNQFNEKSILDLFEQSKPLKKIG